MGSGPSETKQWADMIAKPKQAAVVWHRSPFLWILIPYQSDDHLHDDEEDDDLGEDEEDKDLDGDCCDGKLAITSQ